MTEHNIIRRHFSLLKIFKTQHTLTQTSHQEVERAFKELVEENEGNEKYIMQLEMMKEDIFDQRLRARMSGAMKSKVKESPFDAKLQVCASLAVCV